MHGYLVYKLIGKCSFPPSSPLDVNRISVADEAYGGIRLFQNMECVYSGVDIHDIVLRNVTDHLVVIDENHMYGNVVC